ncbi:MAG: uracil phosphoribosyltransferase, partial [Candidatus Izemoplasmataceae bacterium]
MSKVHILNHPLIEHKMCKIRDKFTDTKTFRENVSEISGLMAYEITRDLSTVDFEVETPLEVTTCKQLSKEVVIV